MSRQSDYDTSLWGPPMSFYEAIELSKDGVAGLFDELPDDWAEDAPGTVLNARLDPAGYPVAFNRNHSDAELVPELVRERADWHALHPKDAVTRLGWLAP